MATTDTQAVPRLLLTPREAARTLRISERTLYQWTKQRGLPCVRLGRTVRYSPDAVRAWITKQEKGVSDD